MFVVPNVITIIVVVKLRTSFYVLPPFRTMATVPGRCYSARLVLGGPRVGARMASNRHSVVARPKGCARLFRLGTPRLSGFCIHERAKFGRKGEEGTTAATMINCCMNYSRDKRRRRRGNSGSNNYYLRKAEIRNSSSHACCAMMLSELLPVPK
jgi:hypothetical protein